MSRKPPSLWELAEQALSSTERGYDLLAPKFDATPFRTPAALLSGCERYLAASPGPKPQQSLDLCCGTGAGMEMLRRVTSEEVVGIDLSRNMLEVARGHLCLQRYAGLLAGFDLIRADVMQLSSLSALHGRFDVVTCFGALGHILEADQRVFFDGVRQCMKPGARLVLVTFTPPTPWSPLLWAARLYNAATRLRNALIEPPFHMYYLSFMWPKLGDQLEAAGFDVDRALASQAGLFPAPFQSARLVVATRPTS